MARKVDRARLHVHSTFNNTILTLTDLDGHVLAWASPGTRGFKGSKKGTPYAAQLACESLIAKMRELGVRSLIVTINGTGQGRNSVVNTLKGSGIRVEDVKNVTPVSHSAEHHLH